MTWTNKGMQCVSLLIDAVTKQLIPFKYTNLHLKTHWSHVSHNKDPNTEISSC